MAFDFNKTPLRIAAFFPSNATVLDFAVYGYCQMSCFFCFANLNRDVHDKSLHKQNTLEAFFHQVELAEATQGSSVGYFLRHRYPSTLSNTTDPFQREEKKHRVTEAILRWAKAGRYPIQILTRGNVLFEEFDRYRDLIVPGKDAVYISITHESDASRKKTEPGALDIESRWSLAKLLTDSGIPVTIACNPYLKEWVPDKLRFVERCAAVNAEGIYCENLHFTANQMEVVPKHFERYLAHGTPLAKVIDIEMREWSEACHAAGVRFCPTASYNGIYGPLVDHDLMLSKQFGGKTWGIQHEMQRRCLEVSSETGEQFVAFTWRDIEAALHSLGVVNEVMRTNDLRGNFSIVSDENAAYRAVLGPDAKFFEILRYFWNHPWDNQRMVWQSRQFRIPRLADGCYPLSREDDLIGVYDSEASILTDRVFDAAEFNFDTAATLNSITKGLDDHGKVLMPV